MTNIKPFALEGYCAKYLHSAKYMLSCSDCESLSMAELVAMAGGKSIEMWQGLTLGYVEAPGHLAVRESIAQMYSGMASNNVMVAAPSECISLFMLAMLKPGDHVICTHPVYQSLYEVARSIGCEVSMWKVDENGGWRFDPNKLEELIRNDTKLVVVNFPHNPTGCVPTADEFKDMVSAVKKCGAYLLSDEMYRLLEMDETTTLPSACEVYDRAITLSGLSKIYGLPGLRKGWLVTKASEVLAQMGELRHYTTICNSAPSEILALMALENRDKIIAGHKERLSRNLTVLEDFLEKNSQYMSWHRPKGSSVCFPRLLVDGGSYDFCEKLVNEASIMLIPSRMFDCGDDHVRIGFGRDNFGEVLSLFEGYLSENF